ncbi:MAG: hypothetical protein IJQ93_09375 [Bacteroidales bacterium]|nr:hypothetical protein [Bacteroidales bacterium]
MSISENLRAGRCVNLLGIAASVLAEPGAVYGERMRVSLEIPASDRDLLSAIALRLGWEME